MTELDLVFRALANATRRAICDELKHAPADHQANCARASPSSTAARSCSTSACSKRAGLVVAAKKGRERFNYLDAMPIQADPRALDRAARRAGGAALSRSSWQLESGARSERTR